MSRQGVNRSSLRSSSKMVGSNEAIPAINDSTHRDQTLTSPSTLVRGEPILSASRVSASVSNPNIQHSDDPPVNKRSMNLRRSKIEQHDIGQDLKRSPDFKMQLRHKPKPTDSMDWQSTPSPSTSTTKTSQRQSDGQESSAEKPTKKNSPLLSDVDEFFDPFKSSPSDDGPGKSTSDESLGVDRKFSNASHYEYEQHTKLLSHDIQSPLNPSVDRQSIKTTTFSRSAYSIPSSSSFPLRAPTDDPNTHVTQLFQPDLYPSTIQQSPWQQHENSWAQSPVTKLFKKEDMSPMIKTMSSTSFSSPPPKKRRFIASSNTGADNNTIPSESISKHNNNVFRSPAGNPWHLSSKSPLFTKDSDTNLQGMSFGLDTPGRSKFDDLLPQAPSFDAMPLPVHGEDAQSPFNGMTSQSALEFASRFHLSRSYSMEEGPDVNFASHPSLPGQYRRYAIPSPYSSERRPQHHLRAGSDHRIPSMQQPESFPPEFMSPPAPPMFQKNIHPPMALPQFPPGKKVKIAAESTDAPDFRNIPRPMVSHPPQYIPSSMDRGARLPHSAERELFSPGPFRVKIGNVGGLQQAEARRGMDGINSIMKEESQQSTYSSKPGVFSPIKKGAPTPSTIGSARHEIQTPLRIHRPVGGTVVSGGIAGAHQNPGSASTNRSFPTPRYPKFLSPSPHILASSSAYKGSSKSPASTERNPCNCKKCKCLKLYCECFAAELYCDNCNCNDCNNTPEFDNVRDKARKDTTAKNPNAFKKKISDMESPTSTSFSPHQGHNMGCRCKKSSCLMKYCECFQSNVFCAGKCKCADCKNFQGSQALIDRRRKIKDNRGAEKASRSSDELWKADGAVPGQQPEPIRRATKSSTQPQPPPSQRHYLTPGSIPSYHPMINNRMANNRMSHPNPARTPAHPSHQYIHQNLPGRAGPMGYTPASGMKPTPPAYMSNYRGPYAHMNGPGPMSMKPPPNQTPQLSTPRTPKSRRRFDFHLKQKADLNQRCSLFGSQATISKGVALQIFSYLPNDAIYNASLVNREWCKLSVDEELWQY